MPRLTAAVLALAACALDALEARAVVPAGRTTAATAQAVAPVAYPVAVLRLVAATRAEDPSARIVYAWCRATSAGAIVARPAGTALITLRPHADGTEVFVTVSRSGPATLLNRGLTAAASAATARRVARAIATPIGAEPE